MLLTHVNLPINPAQLADFVGDHCVMAAANLDGLLARAQSQEDKLAIQVAIDAYDAAFAAMCKLADSLEAVAATNLRESVEIL